MTTLKSNMLKKGKKGFTLTELAIVIAVIAILIAVLVPTFTSVINSARRTTAAETASHALTEYTIETYTSVPDNSIVVNGDYYWTVENGSFEVSDDGDSDDVTTTNMVEYVWSKEADDGIAEVTLYIPVASVDSSLAETIAENIADTYSSSSTIVYITVSGVSNSSSVTHYFAVSGSSTAYTVEYKGTSGTTTGTQESTASYVGITIYCS